MVWSGALMRKVQSKGPGGPRWEGQLKSTAVDIWHQGRREQGRGGEREEESVRGTVRRGRGEGEGENSYGWLGEGEGEEREEEEREGG